MRRSWLCSTFSAIALFAAVPATRAQTGSTCQASVGVQAIAVSTFLDSLGVVTHAGQGYPTTAYTTPIQYLGIHNIRDSGPAAGLVTLHQQTGVKIDAIWADGTIAGLISLGHTLQVAGALVSFEGPNEPNNQPITYNSVTGGGTGSWLAVANYQKDMYAAIKADATLAAYPVLDISEGGAEQDNVGLQFLQIPTGSGLTVADGTKFADLANTHNYVVGNNVYWDNMAWGAADKVGSSPPGQWDGLYNEYGKTWLKSYLGYTTTQLATLPSATTETGWDSVTSPSNLPTGADRLALQGKILTNVYLAQFKRGWTYTYLYNMRDGEGSTDNFGIYNADWTPKTAATYIHNLTTILAGTAGGTLGKLNYTIPSEPTTVHDLLLQKPDSTFELVVWGEAMTTSNPVSVNLGGVHSTVNVYDITSGTTPVQTYANVSTVNLTLTDHALIVETR